MSYRTMHGCLIGLAATLALAAPASAADDTTPPSAPELVAPAADAFTNDSTPTLTWTPATDDVGVAGYALTFDGEYLGDLDAADCTGTCEVTLEDALDDGSHTWRVYAFDAADNETASALRSFVVDTRPPVIGYALPEGAMLETNSKGCVAGSPFPVTGADSVTLTIDGSPKARPFLCVRDGSHVFSVTATDKAGNTATGSRTYRTNSGPPRVDVVIPTRGAVGVPVAVESATAMETIPSGPLSATWTAIGLAPVTVQGQAPPAGAAIPTFGVVRQPARLTFATTGSSVVTVSVTDGDGDVGTRTGTIVIGPEPPAGVPQVLINEDDEFTNRRAVKLSVVWPAGAAVAQIANTGDKAPKATALAETVPWTLAGSGTRRTKTKVTARFDWPTPTKAYTDSIVLDLEKPKVRTAAFRGGKLRTTVAEKVSGVATIQTAVRKFKPAKAKPYSKAFKAPKSTKWVRVTDKAGNVSAWKQIRTR